MIGIRTDFPYLGTRDYIHATSILSGFLDALEGAGGRDITVKRLKFQRPAKSNGRIVLAAEPLAAADLEAANCTLLATAAGTQWRGLFSEEGRVPTRRQDVRYAIRDLEARGFGGTCRIAPVDRDDLIRVLVEANKRFHEAAIDAPAPVAVRFGYLENWAAPPAAAAFDGKLTAENLIARKSDDGHLTINRLTYSGGNGGASLVLCFNVTSGARAS